MAKKITKSQGRTSVPTGGMKKTPPTPPRMKAH